MHNILLSIIMPVYNPNSDYLLQAVNSVLSQTLREIELIIIDDGSSFDVIEKNKAILNDTRIKFIKLDKNSGAGVARNEGIKVASGDYIAFLDADDYYSSLDVLEKLYNIAISNDLNVVGAIPLQNENGVLSPIYWSFKDYKTLFTNQIANVSDYQICYGYWSYIYRRAFLLNHDLLFQDLKRFQDPPWFLSVLSKAQIFYAANFSYYVHRNSAISEFNWNELTLKDYFKGLTQIVDMSLQLKYFDLHTFLYRKLFFNEYLLCNELKELKEFEFVKSEFDKLLNHFNFEVISSTDDKLPILKTILDFNAIDINDYKGLNY